MTTKQILQELTNYLKAKYEKAGVSFSNQTDGTVSSTISFGLSADGTTQSFKIILAETHKVFE